jgi:CRISPR-associated endonuclease/helicase Cas3
VITKSNLWAKLTRDTNGAIVEWHSLVHHSADVAAVLLVLLEQPTIAARLARLAGRQELDSVRRARLGALAFLHDMGKVNRGFRARVEQSAPLVGHIDQVAWLYLSSYGEPYLEAVQRVLGFERMETWFASDEAGVLIDTLFAHHGRPWQCKDSKADWCCGPDGDPVADLKEMREALDRWFPDAFRPGPALPDAPAFHHAFAGLLMLADWLASDKGFFPYANGAGGDRMAEAMGRARDAVSAIGLHVVPLQAQLLEAKMTFTDVFRNRHPRPVQAIITEPLAKCVVLEAETGSGKTEAALWRFKHLFERGEADGLYFALPTRVAATAMFGRVRAFRDRMFGGSPPAVVLAVPGQVAADEAEGRPLPEFGFEWDDAPDHGAQRARWAAEHPKRFLAAPIAVGTVDQALLSAVRVKHAHLRGATLLRHLLVVDEVHASDRYMETLLSALLRNHVGAGGHALLLSATLGAGARARLLGTSCPDPGAAEAVPYPALSWLENGQERRLSPGAGGRVGPGRRDKEVQIETADLLDDPDGVAQVALAAAEAGAKVLVIRNTVAAAVATSRALENLAGPQSLLLFRLGEVVTVHHSRFAAPDRRALDAAVEDALGIEQAEGGRVVVGTQTLEVSLDLDADLLLTDLCPVDVLPAAYACQLPAETPVEIG